MIKSIKKKPSKEQLYAGTHRHQELTYESQQWWQTDHPSSLFIHAAMHDGSHEWDL